MGVLQNLFDLRDPRAFPRLAGAALSDADREVLERFIEAGQVLAASSQLSSSDGMTVHIDEAGIETVDASFAAPDVTAGFAAYFRQCYGNDEPASFNRVMGILMKAAKTEAEPLSTERQEELRRWGGAVRELRAKSHRRLVLEELHRRGQWPPLDEVDLRSFATEQPEKVISEYLYGEHLHWGDHAPTLAQRKESEFEDAWGRMTFLESMAPLAYLYIGFSALVESALRGQT